MPKLTIDGRETEVRNGATVMDAANGLGIYIPHFCYHKKLSIAANCRMCLVQIEKAPKPQPACATPVGEGMKVFTRSDYAREAQNGVMELGMIGRGEHAEIIAFVGKTVDSELSGNVIDLCPVGALTSKPFRYTARNWELSQRKSVSPHDSLGSNLIVQIKQNRVMRVLPLESEELNECWLSDRDRFSYEGLNSEERLKRPMLKEGGRWREVDWRVALERVAKTLAEFRFRHGPEKIGALASPHSTLEELYLLQKLVRAMGSDNVDFRLRQSDFSADGKRAGAPWLGMKIAELGKLDRVLVIGSFLRKDHPLIAHRLRQAAKRRAQVNILHSADDELLMPVANKAIVAPRDLAAMLAQVVKAAAEAKRVPVPAALDGIESGAEAKAIAGSLVSGKEVAILLGNFAAQHPQAAQLQLLAQELAGLLGAKFGFLGEAANSVGGYLAGCVPSGGGLNAGTMLEEPRKAYLLLNAEPDFDCHDPRAAVKAMEAAELVVAMTAFRSFGTDYADVLLPVAPFTETSGSFVNCEGRMQSFNGAVKPLGEARPAWKVLRVLGNLMSLPGFEYESTEAVRDEICRAEDVAGRLDSRLNGITLKLDSPPASGEGLQRIADVPIYFGDPIVRRAASLQRTRDALPPRAWVGPMLAQKLGVKAGERVRVRQGEGEAIVELGIDERLPAGCVRLAAAHRHTAALGPMFGPVSLERT